MALPQEPYPSVSCRPRSGAPLPLPPPACLQVEIALDFARGMAYLHSRRQPIVHRDLKPANLMIAGNLHADTEQLYLDSGVIKVADFGERGREGGRGVARKTRVQLGKPLRTYVWGGEERGGTETP